MARPRGRGVRSLHIPVTTADGRRVWLTPGQRLLLMYVRARVLRGAGPFTLAQAADALGSSRGTISRQLDRLASLSLVGRQSRRGRGHRTLVWLPGARRARMEWARPTWRNVATATPYGGYLSASRYRERIAPRPAGGGTPPAAAGGAPNASRAALTRRFSTPPVVLWGQCPGGHRFPLRRRRYALSRRGLEGSWEGRCRRCDAPVVETITAELLPPKSGGGLVPVAEVISRWLA